METEGERPHCSAAVMAGTVEIRVENTSAASRRHMHAEGATRWKL